MTVIKYFLLFLETKDNKITEYGNYYKIDYHSIINKRVSAMKNLSSQRCSSVRNKNVNEKFNSNGTTIKLKNDALDKKRNTSRSKKNL